MAVGMLLELSAAIALVARPISPFALPPKPAVWTFVEEVAQPPTTEASAMSDSAEPNRTGLDMALPLAFGLGGHCIEFRASPPETCPTRP